MTNAHGHHHTSDPVASMSPVEFWESRYGEADRIWTGSVNRVLADVAAGLTPGRALDLGCGEGGDAVWLAQQGWTVTGVDLSATAIERGRQAAVEVGIDPARLTLVAADLATWDTTERFDLVTCSFLHAWSVPLPRAEILTRATGFVAPGGHLLITSHASGPSWSDAEVHTGHDFPTPESELADLALDPDRWQVITSELRDRRTTAPDGTAATLSDVVTLVRRVP
ncbi:class I SAM-dependent methyltransferase [Kribbia dieselivorans]|uniref:class I SAM-dependent methyltransferase n=1 Tax=Kribbia dieselivorans TaxID=331526 RepID=UPI000837B428|nr:class I SAM-dependent methyltransferase [Kribbia dieselivorans]